MSKAQGITMRSGGGNKKAKKMAGALMFQRFPNGTMKLMKPEDSIDVAAANAEGNTPTFFIIPEVSQVMLHLLLASMYAPVEVVIGNDNGKKVSLWCNRDRWWITNEEKKTIWTHTLVYTEGRDTKLDPNGPNDVMYEILAQFVHPMDRKERKDTIRMLAAKAIEAKKIRDDRLKLQEQKANGKACAAVLLAWVKEDLKIGKPSASAWHKLEHALKHREVAVIAKALSSSVDETALGVQDMQVFGLEHDIHRPQVFVVEHDWAAAFSGAQDFDEGSVPLPYELTAFEFSISGLKVIALISETRFIPFVQVEDTWTIPQLGYFRTNDEEWEWEHDHHVTKDFFEKLKDLILRQVRAVCIMMDATVVETNEVTASEKFNRIRVSQGKVPLLAITSCACIANTRVGGVKTQRKLVYANAAIGCVDTSLTLTRSQ
jgi:hypothetical protein